MIFFFTSSLKHCEIIHSLSSETIKEQKEKEKKISKIESNRMSSYLVSLI